MSEYTSTREGFQRSMKASLSSSPEETQQYADTTVMPTFYHVMNGKHLDYDAWLNGITAWKSKISDYEVEMLVTSFLLASMSFVLALSHARNVKLTILFCSNL